MLTRIIFTRRLRAFVITIVGFAPMSPESDFWMWNQTYEDATADLDWCGEDLDQSEKITAKVTEKKIEKK